MQNQRALEVALRILWRSRTRMVHHQPPALWSLVIHISRNDMGGAGAVRREDFDLFKHMVHRTGQGVHPADVFGFDVDCTTVGKQGIKGGANRACATQPGSARMDAGNVIFVGPAAHEFFEIAPLQSFVKGGFDFVRCSAYGGKQFCFLS